MSSKKWVSLLTAKLKKELKIILNLKNLSKINSPKFDRLCRFYSFNNSDYLAI